MLANLTWSDSHEHVVDHSAVNFCDCFVGSDHKIFCIAIPFHPLSFRLVTSGRFTSFELRQIALQLAHQAAQFLPGVTAPTLPIAGQHSDFAIMTDTNSDAAAPVVVTTLPSMNPPLFFEIVEDLVYRSNKCDATSFPFLATLQLNTVVYLSYDDLSRDLAAFFAEKEINVIHLGMKYRTASSQWKGISEGMAKETIEYILDQRRHPILVMCKTGVHFAGTMIGCLRRLQNWSLTSTIDKYRNIAGSVKTRFENEQFIELFDVDLVTLPQQLPSWFTVHQQLTEEERIALTRGEFFPGRTLAIVEEQPKKEPPQLDAKTENEVRPEIEEVPAEATETPVLAYQKYFFYLQGPLVSSSVKFSEKKSIIGDDDDD
ncbi:hypothetical protein PC118_g21407 [Phytophthora cactorum]|uniref:Protein-tyrosine phosphatase-like n=2 Tax=Phytophthora cactorum TaxID=29920 RepID=A0A8T1EV39_9STRA|nr:hypothetical protein PC118_g21407 [Phytophthora cactorum]